MTLTINKGRGYATELDAKEISYNLNYFDILKSYENTDIDKKLMRCRVDLVRAYCDKKGEVFDFGCGTGQFLRKIRSHVYMVYGYDVMIASKKWLKDNFMYLNPYSESNQNFFMEKLTGVCFWDSLEHLEDPSIILNFLPENCFVFISIPIFDDIEKIKQSKHYRPGEHYWYFTHRGLLDYMYSLKYIYFGYNDCESKAGRKNIYSYVFRKALNFNINH
jgi:SAM-dependent methyltransferase